MNAIAPSLDRAELTSLLEWVDSVADRFETAWKNGASPRIVDYLGAETGERRSVLLRELAKIDLERRLKAGEKCSWDEYVRIYPELDSVEKDLLAVLSTDGQTRLAASSSERNSLPPLGRFLPRRRDWPVIEGFDILSELGHGGMGTVFKARQQRLKRTVALKLLHTATHADSARRSRFRTEAEATARLQHANIAQVYEIGERDGVPYLVMEYVEGGSLGLWLRGKPQSPLQSAELVVSLARAMDYAHRQGVVHRDLKPDNILLHIAPSEREGPPRPKKGSGTLPRLGAYVAKITDFGLAKLLENESSLSRSGAVVGTPSYMAPEQAAGKSREVGPATDIYALGAILYEMLTGRPPFQGDSLLDILEQVRRSEPVPPSQLLPKVPRDLETICLKALSRSPTQRYASAGDLADDLDRFLKGEPIRARPVGRAERVIRWCRRRPAQAGLTAMAVALALTVLVASVLLALFSTARERSQRREGLLQQLQLVRAGERLDGWSEQAWSLIGEAARLRNDAPLRSLAAAASSDLDARPGKSREWVSASWSAFSSDGGSLLLGGKNDSNGRKSEGAKLWEVDSERVTVSWRAGAGPVAFDRNGAPLQLTARDGRSLMLWNLSEQKLVREIALKPSPDPKVIVEPRKNVLGFPLLSLSRHGDVGAAAVTVDGRGSAVVWSNATGETLFCFDRRTTALTLAPRGNLLAAGDDQGSVALWTVPEGKRLGAFQMSASAIHTLAFSPNGKRLGAADASRSLTVWDAKERMPLAHCRGAQHEVYALAFNGDGTLLASGGRGPTLVWDAATGRQLLGLHNQGVVTSLAFAPGSLRLAVGSQSPSRVALWELEANHGIQTLRGLNCRATQLCFSSDGKQVAALTPNGTIGLWNLERGKLHRLLTAPRGHADQAALAFSPDGQRLVCAAETEAILWETAKCGKITRWELPMGSRNLLAFPSSEALLLFREESGAGSDPNRPGACRVRDLLGPKPSQPLFTITEFNSRLLDAALTSDGATLLIEGTMQEGNSQRRRVKAYDARTGGERWALDSTRTPMTGTLALDPTGRYLSARTDNRVAKGALVDIASGQRLAELEPSPACLGPEAKLFIVYGPGSPREKERGYALCRRDRPTPCLILGMETIPSFRPAFSLQGRYLAWSNADGTIAVCDLPRLRNRFVEAGLICEELDP